MGKLSKLVLAGLGAYAIKYYLDNPKKKEEHTELVKEKVENSIGYSKCMWNYTKKNGVAASAEYLKNDLVKVVNRNKEKLNEKVDKTVEFGKQLAEDVSSIKDNGFDVKEKSIELKSNIAEAKKVLKKEIAPVINNYVENAKNAISSITDKTSEVKKTINEEQVVEKVNDYKEKVESSVEEAKETIEDIKKELK